MSANDLLTTFGRSLTVTRYAAGSYVNGTFVAGATSTLEAIMSVQPINGRELVNVPEAQRTKQFLKGYSDTELFTAQQSAAKKADTVSIDSITYEVQAVEYWQSTGSDIAPHWKVLLAEANVNP